MAHQLQALTAVIWAASLVEAADFSHRVHLGARISCATCHAAAESTRLEDSLLPSPKVCLSCHRQGGAAPPLATPPIILAQRQSLLTRFNHKLHLGLGNIAPVLQAAVRSGTYLAPAGDLLLHLQKANSCTACHRGLEQSDQTTPAAFPRMADCLVCHSKIDPPFSCEKCHAPGPHLKPANHVANWIEIHSSGKANLDKASCAVCHGKRFTCLGCHT